MIRVYDRQYCEYSYLLLVLVVPNNKEKSQHLTHYTIYP